jgi:DNA modification methylase
MLICFTLEPRPTFNTLNIEGGIDFNDNTVSLNEGNRTISHWLIGENTIVTNVNNFSAIKKKCSERGIPFEHSAGFPSIIPQLLIQLSTKPGDVVMDIFLGTGVTAYEALRLGRNFIGYEINPDYFRISQVRLEEFLNDGYDGRNEVVLFDFKNRLKIPSSNYTEIFSKRILWPKQNYAC